MTSSIIVAICVLTFIPIPFVIPAIVLVILYNILCGLYGVLHGLGEMLWCLWAEGLVPVLKAGVIQRGKKKNDEERLWQEIKELK